MSNKKLGKKTKGKKTKAEKEKEDMKALKEKDGGD